MENSKFLSIKQQDWIKSFWVFLFSTAISVIGDAIMQGVTNGSYSLSQIHWKEIGLTILVAVISYLKKQLFTNSEGEILTKEHPKNE